jgi:hypothetical protein
LAEKTDCILLYNRRVFIRNCCGKFYPKDTYRIKTGDYLECYLESGFCPHCNNWVVEVHKKTYDGVWVVEAAKRKKAQRLYNQYKDSIIGSIGKNPKSGNKSNMGFRYGENKIVGDTVKQYSVDFNGTKKLIKTLAL